MKDPVIGRDSLGLPIYETQKFHRSQRRLKNYCICQHICPNFEHGWSLQVWDHLVPPNSMCYLDMYSECESCLTWNFNASKKEKLEQFTPKQKAAVIKWAAKHGVKIT